jgi:hypothetical protein
MATSARNGTGGLRVTPGMRYVRGALASALAASVLLTGCAAASTAGGSGGSAGSGASTAPTSPSTPAIPPSTAPQGGPTSLTVVVDDGAGGANSGTKNVPLRWTLTCDPVGGTHPKAAAACAQLAAAASDPFAPTPPGLMCSMIYGGPQEAHVFGTYKGRAVDTTFLRTNGCQTARWQRVSELLVIRGGAGLQE